MAGPRKSEGIEKRRNLALTVSYYLSRFDRDGYANLGFASFTEAHRSAGEILGLKSNTIKNMRDEFDSIHANSRVGWWQRPIRPSRQKIVDALQDLGEYELRSIVLDILKKGNLAASPDLATVSNILAQAVPRTTSRASTYAARGPTGRAAEDFFVAEHKAKGLPAPGELVDSRDLGCGYDFEIRDAHGSIFVEVKGLQTSSGGVSFTAKEWETARAERNRYHLAVVRNLNSEPIMALMQDPASRLDAQRQVVPVVQVRWLVDANALSRTLHDR